MQTSIGNVDDLKMIAVRYGDEIRERHLEFEQLRHFPQDLADRMARDGLYQVCTPADYGGEELSPRVYAEIVEQLAKADASAAWSHLTRWLRPQSSPLAFQLQSVRAR